MKYKALLKEFFQLLLMSWILSLAVGRSMEMGLIWFIFTVVAAISIFKKY